jgi:uncharacterized membrane protein
MRNRYAVGGITLAAAAFYAVYALVRYTTYKSTTYDLVIFDQAVRSYSEFHLPVSLAKGVHNGFGPHFSVLGDHFSPVLMVLAPLYWIHNGPQTLLVAQAVLLAAAIPPLWIYVQRILGVTAAYCVVGVYAISWPVAGAVAFDFHETAFVPVLTAVMLERYQSGRRWQCLAMAGLLLLVKEDMGLLVAGFGLYLLTRRGDRRLGAGFILGGLAWTELATRVFIPASGGSATYYWAYGALGADLPHAALHVLTHPWDAVAQLGTPQVKLATMAWLLLPLLLLPLASPLTLAILPPLAARMLASSFPNWWDQRFQYNVALVIILLAASVDGAARLRRFRIVGYWPVAALVVAAVTVPQFAFGSAFDPGFYRHSPRARAAARAVSVVPSGVLVETADVIGPHLSGRDRVLLWDLTPRGAPWVVADVTRRTFPYPDLQTQQAQVAMLISDHYRIVWQSDGYVVLNRPGSIPDLRAYR